jgi:hypothetical protein
MAYNLKDVTDQLKAYSGAGVVPYDAANVNDLGSAVAGISAALVAGGALQFALRDIITSKKNTEYNGYTIYYVPTSDELLARFAAAAVFEKMGLGTFTENVKGASEISRGTLDKWLGSTTFNIPAASKKAWDDNVKNIKDAMVARSRAAGLGVDAVLFPVGETVRVFTNTGVTSRPTPSYEVATTGALPSVNALKFTWGMKGGSVSSHAPLYPAVVMNGGAHPFATFSGGDGAKAVAHIEASITAMENQFKLLTGKNLSEVTGAVSPNSVVARVKTDVNDLEAALAKLRNANLALASAPLAAGVQPDYATLVAAGEEISKKAEKASRGWDRLSQIHEALKELVAKQQMVKLSGGLHNALKH